MEKKSKVGRLLMVLGVICVVMGGLMLIIPDDHVNEVFWVPLVIGVLPLGIGIALWLNN